MLSVPVWALGLMARHGLATELSAQADRRATAAAAQLRSVHRAQQDAQARALSSACKRDVGVERMLLELGAGPQREADLRRTLRPLRRTMGVRNLWLVDSRKVKGRVIAREGSLPGPRRLDPEILKVAMQRPVVFAHDAEEPLLLRSCQARKDVWLVAASRADGRWLSGLGQVPSDVRVTQQSGRAPPSPYRRFVSSSDAIRLFDHTDRPMLQITATAAAQEATLALLEVASIGTGLLTLFAALALFLRGSRRPQSPPEQEVFAALQTAANSVAAGDLNSTIGLATAGQAGQTVQAFNRMTEELRATRAKLLQAERVAAWQEIARRIAHELKNPLSPIQTAIETLRKTHARKHPDFEEIFQESTLTILEEVKRLERIVREFSEFARLPRPRPGQLDVGSLVRQVTGLYADDDGRLQCDVRQELPSVRADREQLTQVITNLLQNALDASGEGTPAVRVRVSAAAERGVLVEVEDNGPGIALEDRERVFEPYFSTKSEGTGLGLAIAQRIIKDHGGRLSIADSDLGGARFRIVLTPEGPPAAATDSTM